MQVKMYFLMLVYIIAKILVNLEISTNIAHFHSKIVLIDELYFGMNQLLNHQHSKH